MRNNHEARLPAIEVSGVTKRFLGRVVLNEVSVSIPEGELTLLTGPSGSGKTTLLNIMSGVDRPNSGLVGVGEYNIARLSARARAQYRAQTGQIFQRSGLIAGLTAEQNIHLPHDLTGQVVDEEWTRGLIAELGIADVLKQPASHLSSGQAQRVAVVRALAHHPPIVFADEPTASLDTQSKKDVHQLLSDVANDGATVVMVSHEEISANYADNILVMQDGVVRQA